MVIVRNHYQKHDCRQNQYNGMISEKKCKYTVYLHIFQRLCTTTCMCIKIHNKNAAEEELCCMGNSLLS